MSAKPELKYVPGLDALRGFACLSVILFHSNFVEKTQSAYVPFQGGFLGVDLFFVLSGFLITTILVNQFQRESTIHFKNFYIRRVLRLYPAILISVVFFLLPLVSVDEHKAVSNILSLMTYTGDCSMLVQHFTHLPYPKLTGHSWSLAVEEQFYLTFPLLLLSALRYNSRTKKGNLISFLPLFLLLYVLVVVGSTIVLGKWFYKFFVWRFFEIYLGTFLALLYSDAYKEIVKPTRFAENMRNTVQRVLGNGWVLLFAALIVFAFIAYPGQIPFYSYISRYNLQYIIFTLFSAVLIINLVYPRHRIFAKIFANKALISVGKYSYGLYVYTPFILQKVDQLMFGGHPFQSTTTLLVTDVVTVTISLLFSYLSFVLIEKSILKLKSRFESGAGKGAAGNVLPVRLGTS